MTQTGLLPSDVLTGHEAAVTAVAFSPDGSVIASGDAERHVMLHDATGPRYRLNLSSESAKVKPTERMRTVVFSPDGTQFYVSASDKMRAFWTETGEETWSYRPPRFLGFLVISPLRMSVSNHGLVAACFDNATVGVWSPFGQKISVWRDPEAPHWMGWLQDGVMIVGADSFTINLWDSRLRVKFARWVSEDRIYNLTVHPTEDTLVVRTLHEHRILNAQTGTLLGSFEASVGLPLVAFRPNRQSLAVVEDDGVLVVNYNGDTAHAIQGDHVRPTSLAWSADGTRLAIGRFDGTVHLVTLP